MITRILSSCWEWFGLRMLVGAIFIYAGAIKIAAPQSFADSIATFRLLPVQLIDLLALGLPFLELSVGGLLLLGKFTRTASLGALLLCAAFALALVSGLIRGLPVDCGCFGRHGASVFEGWISLGRDLLIEAMVLMLYMKQHSSRGERI